MPAASPKISSTTQKVLRNLGEQIRLRRKRLGLSLEVTAEAAGISRITLYRIERGEASVTMGAYLSAVSVLALKLEWVEVRRGKSRKNSPVTNPFSKIRISEFPQLKRLAWQLKDTQELSPQEALDLYERNWRHVDLDKMDEREQALLRDLIATFGRDRPLV
jgi:transcriptional regulator with XRE-family HTH domain